MGLYLIHRENKAYLQGKKSAPYGMGAGATRFLFGCLSTFLILVMLSLPVLIFFGEEQILLILGPTVKAEGLIVDRKVVQGDESTFYYIAYEYVVNNQRFRRQESVDSSLYNRAEPGMRLRIEYLSANPRVARIEGRGREIFFSPALLIILLMVLLVVVVLVYQARESRRQRERLKKGKPIKGQVLQVRTEEREDSDGDPYTATILRVRFQTPQGRMIEGEESYSYKRLRDDPPSTENTVAILYVDDEDWELL